MAERSTGLIAGLIISVILAVGASSFWFAMHIEADELTQVIDGVIEQHEALNRQREDLEQVRATRITELADKKAALAAAVEKREEKESWRDTALRDSQSERSRVRPSVRDLSNAVNDGHSRIKQVSDAMKVDRESFENTRRSKREELRQANERLLSQIANFESKEKNIDTDVSQIKARLTEVEARLKKVQAEALRRKTISDAGGAVIAVGDQSNNFGVINLGTADRIRKGQKFEVWSLKRGYGLGWVQVDGRDFVKEGILPGDMLVVGRRDEEQRYPIVAVGISKEAELKGTGLARRSAVDTIKVLGAGVNASFTVAGQDFRVERVTTAMTPAEAGAVVKGMVEIAEVRTHTSDVFILPERHQHPVCQQCGWNAPKSDMRYCPYCFLGDSNNEVQPLDESIKRLLNKAENAFVPIAPGDRLSNPYFSSNRPLIFVLGSQPVKRNRQEMVAFLRENGGTVINPDVLLKRPEDLTTIVSSDILPSEINYLIPGVGAEAPELLKRARELGIRVMREEEIFEFFGEDL